jgi:Cu-Zn family superoxide dismutase
VAVRTRTLLLTAALPAAAATLLVALPAVPALAAADRVRAEGPLVRYDTSVPEGAAARVQSVATSSGRTVVTLHVRGLQPDTTYGAHAHVHACGATGGAAGPHYQHVVAPAGEAADTAYANRDNEIWLDLTTDDEGNGAAQTVVDWQFRPDEANSVVLHQDPTAPGPDGAAGTAGPRLACLTVGF